MTIYWVTVSFVKCFSILPHDLIRSDCLIYHPQHSFNGVVFVLISQINIFFFFQNQVLSHLNYLRVE